MAAPQRIAFAITKGGSGKTSTCSNIAGELADRGYRVLVVSLDMQDNTGEAFGYTYEETGDDGAALAHSLITGEPLRPVLTEVRPNLDVVPGGAHLTRATELIVKGGIDVRNLARALPGGYDFILFDCPPNDLRMPLTALVASDWIIVPSQADASSRKGIRLLASQYQEALDYNETLKLLGVVLFDVPGRSHAMVRDTSAWLATELGSVAPVFSTWVPTSKKAAMAASERGVLMRELPNVKAPKWWELRAGKAKGSTIPVQQAQLVADAYGALTDEVLREIRHRTTARETQGGQA